MSHLIALLALGAAPLTGTWASIGYGLIWSFEGDTLRTFEVTTTTCVVSDRYQYEAPREPGIVAVYRAQGNIGAVANDWIIRSASTRRRLVAHTPGTLADVELEPIGAIPKRCLTPTPSDRSSLFEIYARTIAENYAFFSERKLDWDATVAKARTQLEVAEDDTVFYRLLHRMVAPLADAHTKVIAPTLGLNYPTYRRTDLWLQGDELARLRDLAPIAYLTDSLERLDGGRLQFGWLADSIAYLKVTALYRFAETGRFEDDSVALGRSLDRIFARITRARGLVIDLRINGGGYDGLARLLAGRLTDRPYRALVKQARRDPMNPKVMTRPSPVTIVPSMGARFSGPMVVLIGIRTVSAGEVLTMMLLGRTPKPILIGQPTQGVFADELVRRLPNGWQFQLSSERYALPNGHTFEGPGIPPDVSIPAFPPTERDGRKDGPLEAALARLRGRPTEHRSPR